MQIVSLFLTFCISFTVLSVIAANSLGFRAMVKKENMFKILINCSNLNFLGLMVAKNTKNALNYILKLIKIRTLCSALMNFQTFNPRSLLL